MAECTYIVVQVTETKTNWNLQKKKCAEIATLEAENVVRKRVSERRLSTGKMSEVGVSEGTRIEGRKSEGRENMEIKVNGDRFHSSE